VFRLSFLTLKISFEFIVNGLKSYRETISVTNVFIIVFGIYCYCIEGSVPDPYVIGRVSDPDPHGSALI
jgi:hypothetical protein